MSVHRTTPTAVIHYDVVIRDHRMVCLSLVAMVAVAELLRSSPPNKIGAIRVVRAETAMGLKEAKDFVDSVDLAALNSAVTEYRDQNRDTM